MRRPDFIARQSRCPTGLLGRVIGAIMSFETAAANNEALKVLGLEPVDRVLEVGFGHGRTIERAAALVPDGFVAGIDASQEMVDVARRRCRRLIEDGRVQLTCGDSASMPYADGFFDKAFGIHVLYFWPDPVCHLRELHRVLRAGGQLVLGFRENGDPAAADFPAGIYTFYGTEHVRSVLQECGFKRVEVAAGSGIALASAIA